MSERRGRAETRGVRRIAAAVVLCLVALPASFIVGDFGLFVGLVLIGCAVWLVARSPWPRRRARVAVSVTLAATTIALSIVVLSQLHFD
jgi:hypothetical protein